MPTWSQRRAWAQVPYLLLLGLCTSLVVFHFLALGNPTSAWSANSSFPKGEVHTDHATQTSQGSASIKLRPWDHAKRPAKTTYLKWNITKGLRRPDGVQKEVILINGEFPGPAIEARSGDEVHVSISNHLGDGEATAIHWHGLKVANDMDGVVGVTQCGIPYGQTFTYRLRIKDDQAGTFWYHSHSEVQRADGLFGALIVHPPEAQRSSEFPTYADDQVLMIGDWYHHPAKKVLEKYMSLEYFKNEIPPDSMLLNGKGMFDCAKKAPGSQLDCEETIKPFLDVAQGPTRLRIINVGSFTGFHVFTPGSTLRAITTDGGGIVSHEKTVHGVGVVHPGERLDIILTSDGMDTRKALVVQLDESDIQRPNLDLVPCQSFPLEEPKPSMQDFWSTESAWAATKVSDYLDYNTVEGRDAIVASSVDDIVLLYGTLAYRSQFANRPRGELNSSSWPALESRTTPLLGKPSSEWPRSALVTAVNAGWIDVVLNNMDDKGHPFHLHGHDFYVMERRAPSRLGAFAFLNPFDHSSGTAAQELYAAHPVRKDTVHVPSRGHVVLRFNADAPGLWLFHCHVLWHQAVGMTMAFRVEGADNGATWSSLASSAEASCHFPP